MGNAWWHFAVFIASIASLTIIVVTGHDDSPLVHQIMGGIMGGIIGGTGVGAAPLISKLIPTGKTPDEK